MRLAVALHGTARRSTVLLVVLTSAAAPAAASAGGYASIGDSFSTGAGAGTVDPGTESGAGNGCSRSSAAWPRLLGVPQANHFACGGATVDSLFAPQKTGPKARADAVSQLDRLRTLTTTTPISRVYITVGLNDIDFGPIIASCVQGSCLRNLRKVQYPFLDFKLQPEVISLLKTVRRAAPQAQMVLVGYPILFAKKTDPRGGCSWLDDGEAARWRQLQSKLDSTLGGAATAGGAFYVSVRGAFRGHEICSPHSWVEPVTTRNPRTGRLMWLRDHHGCHPNAKGQRSIARYVARAQGAFPPNLSPYGPPLPK